MNGGAELVIVVPLWRRHKNLERLVASARDTVPDAEVLFVVSTGDRELCDAVWGLMWRHAAAGEQRLYRLELAGPGGERGDYARKINAGYRYSDRPQIFTAADDLVFHPGWHEAASALLEPPVGVVGTVDQCNTRTVRGEHSTHSLIARWYADAGATADGQREIYHEGYWHEYCDDELVRCAMSRGAYAHADGAVVEHVHMLLDSRLDDDVYRHGRQNTGRSRRLFLNRRRLWGDRAPRSGAPQFPRRVSRA